MLTALRNMVVNGDDKAIREEVRLMIDKGLTADEIITDGLKGGMELVDMRWQNGDMFIPEVIVSANTVQAAMEALAPFLNSNNITKEGKIAIGTVQGDLHTIGKSLVKIMLEGAQFEVIDLGVNVTPQKFAEVVENEAVDILGISSLLTTTMPSIKDVLDVLERAGLRNKVKVIIGGAPITQDFADKIGADGYGVDASAAVKLCLQLMKK